jgi:hypothetical protein
VDRYGLSLIAHQGNTYARKKGKEAIGRRSETHVCMSAGKLEESRKEGLRASVSAATLEAYTDKIRMRKFAKETDKAPGIEKRH